MRKTPFFLLCAFLTILAVLTLVVFGCKSAEKNDKNQKVTYLELWHVDTFEGGTGSRKAFLEKVASDFNLIGNVKVIVKQQTTTSCYQNFKNQVFPDIISYGNGLDLPIAKLYKIEVQNHSALAKVWCTGGYLVIKRANVAVDGIILSTQQNTISLLAYYLSGVELPLYERVESQNAVYSFYKNENKALLGTQRDLYRLQNKGLSLEVETLNGYNDLYQFVSVLSNDKTRARYAVNFIEYLLSEKAQSQLYKIGMLSNDISINNQVNSPLTAFNNTHYNYVTPNLITLSQIKNLKKQAENFKQNVESIKNALKRLK